MTRKLPKDFDFFTAFLDLPESERKMVGAYVYCRTLVKGCRPGEMTPAELMQWLSTVPSEEDAA